MTASEDAARAARRRRAVAVGVALLVTFGCCCLPYRTCVYLPALLDDGPFHGVECDAPPDPSETPTEVLDIAWRRHLEVYAPRSSDAAPRLVFRESSGTIRWCRVMSASNSAVRELHLDAAAFTAIPGRIAVAGVVVWTYGHERAEVYLTYSGDLIEYWYSW